MQEATELIDLASHDDVRPRILFKIIVVVFDLLLVGVCLLGKSLDRVTHFEDGEEVPLP